MDKLDAQLDSWAGRFAEVELFVVGSMMIDQVTYCARFPADGETLVATRYAQGFGGKGANQAVMAARLGAHVAFIGCLGDDDAGDLVIDNFATFGVDAAQVARVSGVPSGVASIWVDETGTNRILIAPGANHELNADHVTGAFGRRSAATHAVVAQLETPQAATAEAFRWARHVGAITILNPAPGAPVDPAVLELLDWLVANESEFAILSGSTADPESIAVAALKWHCGVVVTLGAAGALFATAGHATVAAASPAATAVDTTGAGDAFVGAFGVGLAARLTPLEAVHIGCASGSLSVRQPGTQSSYATCGEVMAAVASTVSAHESA
ncbi:ribokinase [soil metagenome]